MRAVFMGTPRLAACVLEQVAADHRFVGVFTRPDAVRGRGKTLVASPVKDMARSLGIDVHTPQSLRDPSAVEELAALKPDVVCVAAYGAILPPEVLRIPTYGCLNVHTSLLPRWRGAAPMQRAILAHDEQAGVCIMRMEEGLDTGPYCARVEVPLDGLYLEELESELARAGAQALSQAIGKLEEGGLTWTEQGDEGVVYAPKLAKGELDLALSDTAREACAKVRASDAAHPAHATVAGRALTIERACEAHDEQALQFCEGLSSGQAVFRGKRFFVMCADVPLELQQVKPEGKKSMDARSFAAGIQGVKNSVLAWSGE